jgi:fibronectin type 3 domain-containing protein
VFNNVVVTDKQVELYFVPSSSVDVKEHIIYRKTDLKSRWEILRTLHSPSTKFIDTTVTTGVTYYYSIRAKDESGLYSHYASAVYGKPYDTGIRPPIENLIAKVEKKNIILQWEYPALKTEYVFVIYKKDNKGQLKQYDTTKEKSYIDKNTNKENYYAIKAVTKDGGQSKLSAVVGKAVD